MEELKFEWEWCTTCAKAFIRCPKCGNNSCNAGSGAFDKDGKITHYRSDDPTLTKCDVCDISYKYYQDNTDPDRKTIKGGTDKEIILAILKDEDFWIKFSDDDGKIGKHYLSNIKNGLLSNFLSRDEYHKYIEEENAAYYAEENAKKLLDESKEKANVIE